MFLPADIDFARYAAEMNCKTRCFFNKYSAVMRCVLIR